jgi:hypothetical protein
MTTAETGQLLGLLGRYGWRLWADAVEKLCFLQKTVKNFAIERQ